MREPASGAIAQPGAQLRQRTATDRALPHLGGGAVPERADGVPLTA